MSRLVLTNEQVQILKAATGHVEMVDPQGVVVGIAKPPLFTAEEIAHAKRVRASNGRRYSVSEKRDKIAAVMAEIEQEEASDAVRR